MLGHGSISQLAISSVPVLAPGSGPATSPWSPGINQTRSIRRRNTTDRQVRIVPKLLSTPLAASSSRSLLISFKTTTTASRKLQAKGWFAALVPTGTPAVVPASAYLTKTTYRRKSTKRRLIEVTDFLSNYIAPTIGAVKLNIKPFRIEYKRELRLTPPQMLYPPPTGPPPAVDFAWVAVKAKRVPQRRRFVLATKQIVYPVAVVTPGPFAEPAAVIRRRETERTLRVAVPAPVYPQTPPSVPFAAIAVKPRKARKASNAGFLSVTVVAGEPAAATTPAQYPSFERHGFNVRRDTARRLKTAIVAPVFPYAAPGASADRQLSESFSTRRSRSRKRQTVASVPVFPATPPVVMTFVAQVRSLRRDETERKLKRIAGAPVFPVTPPTPVVFGAVVRAKANRRKASNVGFIAASIVVGAIVEPYVATEAHGYNRRAETKRKHLRAVWPLVYPQIPAAPVVLSALVLRGFNYRRASEYTLIAVTHPPVFPQTPVAPVIFSALTPIGFNRSEATRRLLTATWPLVYPQTPAPAVTFNALVSNGYIYRRNSEYKLLNAAWPLVYPQTPAVPEQPFEAFKTVLSKYAAGLTRRILGVYAPQNIEAAPDIPPVIVPGGGGGGGAGWKKHHEHKRRKDRELEDTIRQIYRELTQEPATTDIAVQIVAPITKPEAKAVPTVQQVEFEKATVEIETALRLVRNQIEDFKRAEESDRQELLEIIEIMHLGGLI